MKGIEIDVLLETKDYWRCYLSYYFSSGSLFYLYLGFTIFGYCVAFLLLGANLPIQIFAEIAVDSALFLVLFNFAMMYFSVKNAKALSDGKCKYIFSDEEVEIVAKSFRSRINWSYTSHVKETANYFMLSMKGGEKHLIPKRFFRDGEQMADFKNILQMKFGEKAALKKSKENLGLK